MEERQKGVDEGKRINNSIRAAAMCIGVSPETILMHIDFLKSADEILKKSQKQFHESETKRQAN
jgi:hypothetical protein